MARSAALVLIAAAIGLSLWLQWGSAGGCNAQIRGAQADVAQALTIFDNVSATCAEKRSAIAALQRATQVAALCRQVSGRQMSLFPYLETAVASAEERFAAACGKE